MSDDQCVFVHTVILKKVSGFLGSLLLESKSKIHYILLPSTPALTLKHFVTLIHTGKVMNMSRKQATSLTELMNILDVDTSTHLSSEIEDI